VAASLEIIFWLIPFRHYYFEELARELVDWAVQKIDADLFSVFSVHLKYDVSALNLYETDSVLFRYSDAEQNADDYADVEERT
jgi:hypothetical protein